MDNVLSLLKFTTRNRLPSILQTEVAECGLACLAMVASYHGHKTDLATLRHKFPISLRGVTLQTLIEIADKLDFACRPLRLELDELDQLQTPTILHWDMNHFVVLKRVTPNYIIIHDPAQGIRKVPLKEVSDHFTGIALELTPTPKFEQKDEVRKIPFSTFWSRIVGLKSLMLRVFVLSIVLQVFALISPWYVQTIVDNVLMTYDTSLLTVLALGFGLIMLIELATTALRSYILLMFSSMLSIQMATNLFRHLIRLPLPFFEKRHIGDIVSRFGSLSQIESFLTQGIVQAVVDGLMSLATLTMIFIYSPLLASIVIASVALYAIVRFVWYRPFRNINEESIVTKAKESSNFMETIRGIQSIKVFGKESQRQVLWQNRFADSMNTGIRKSKMGIVFTTTNALLFGVENILVVFFAAKLVMNPEAGFSVGMMYAFLSYKQQFTSKAAALIENLIELKMLGLHLERLGDIALEKPEAQQTEMQETAAIKGDIEFKQVNFRYNENEPLVLDNVSLKINQGESVAIIGPSGCGKTTLMKLMMGLFEPESGKILIDGQEISQLGHQTFRSQFGAVMQNDQLLSGSMSENIAFFEAQIDHARVEQAAKMAVIDHDIARMPMAYNTLIGDMGTSLSGGQKQRVLLARALYKQPKILFLDEATSHLDIALEQAVNHAVKQLNMTRVIIAHRPETIASADRVLVLTPEGLVEHPKEAMMQKPPEPPKDPQA